ncbi:MAG: NfeD family protein [Tidjanibacter sp.]|nr:NfeD family protein [Tidjanibacter sp.]
MWLIVSLILIAMLLLLVEIVLLPGVSVAGIGAVISYAIAIYKGYTDFGSEGGWIILIASIISAVATIAIAVKANFWQRFSLKDNIDSRSQTPAEELNIERGAKGESITRLAPSGKVMIDGKVFEARSIDKYIDPHSEVEVVDFENFTVIVRKTE